MRDARCDASIGRRRETRVATRTRRMGEFCFTSFRRHASRSSVASSVARRTARLLVRSIRVSSEWSKPDDPRVDLSNHDSSFRVGHGPMDGWMDGWISHTPLARVRRPTTDDRRARGSTRRLNRCNRFPCGGIKPSFDDRVVARRASNASVGSVGFARMGWIAHRGWLACTARYGFWFWIFHRPGSPPSLLFLFNETRVTDDDADPFIV